MLFLYTDLSWKHNGFWWFSKSIAFKSHTLQEIACKFHPSYSTTFSLFKISSLTNMFLFMYNALVFRLMYPDFLLGAYLYSNPQKLYVISVLLILSLI